MNTIILIACSSKKLPHKSKAKDLYNSTLFKKSLKYALSLNFNKIFILSAKYGLLELNAYISSYNKTLNKMNSSQIQKWSNTVLNQLKKVADLKNDKFIFLAGNNYRKFLISYIEHYKIPMQSLSIGKQLHWLSKNIKYE